MLRWLLRGLLALVLLILLAWGALVWRYSDAAGPDVSKWQLALFIADEVGARIYCAVTGCPAVLPEGMTLREWAGQSLVPSTPVAIDVDPWGRVYLAEGDRNQGGAEDNRRHMYWLEDDLASTTVEERRAYTEKWIQSGRIEEADLFTKHADRALVITDEDGDGTADRARELARWNDWVNGIFAGVLWHDGDLWATEIPSLFRLRRVAESDPPEVETLATGFGVKTSLSGHDLHGLAHGPDGKIYFSLGDRGYNVVTREGKRLVPPIDPGRGAVFRINPDGSGLEVFAEGLRNPQELAFDDYGNLFTGDNNGDGGDAARIVYVVEGGDSGWAMPYQTQVGDYLRGQWNAEKLWHLAHPTQPAWIVPPIAHLANGPSGLAHYPGLGLPERYRGHFFLCDYRYQPSRSQVWSFAVEPEGAGFRMVDAHPFIGQILVTDLTFGWDARIYASRYNQFAATSSLVVLENEAAKSDPRIAETVKLAQEGMAGREQAELVALLGHADRRIRRLAQQELVERREPDAFAAVAGDRSQPLLRRLHAVWGLGQLGASALREAGWANLAWADGDEAELRAQAAKIAGEAGAGWLAGDLIRWLSDASPRVRFFAAQSLGKLGARAAVEPLFALIRENADRDAFLRHAAVLALSRIGELEAVAAKAGDPDRAVRMGVLLVLRRAGDVRVARFLADEDPLLVVEAARAIHDTKIYAAYPMLAALSPLPKGEDPQTSYALHRRVIDANLWLGSEAGALALAAHAADTSLPKAMRALALEALGEYARPRPREIVWGIWRPLPARDPSLVHAALDRYGRALVEGDLGERALEIALAYERVPLDDDELLARVEDGGASPEGRAASLRALAARPGVEGAQLDAALAAARGSDEPLLRAEARDVLVRLRPDEALAALEPARFEGERVERQRALRALGRITDPRADALLLEAFVRLEQGQLDPGVELDLLDAARERGTPVLLERVARYESKGQGDLFASRRYALAGGDAERGKLVFQGQGDCQRCHGGAGHGASVGPDLDGVGRRRDAAYVLRSVLEPSAEIAPGFATLSVTRRDGSTVSGTLVSESDGELVLDAGGSELRIPVGEIQGRIGPVSAMPPAGLALSPAELRDLVAYVTTL
jgi:quinoprotein glucose dehydrogenase